MEINNLKKIKIPSKPGVYFFKKKGQTLYIGKATSLSGRVRSYFGRDLIATRGPLLVDMVCQADKILWEETDSVLEALILEAELIKKHQPYYNTREKDNKSFNYVCITKPARNATHSVAGGEKFPRVLVLRERSLKMSLLEEKEKIKFQAKYGPFTQGGQLREAMKIIRRIFPFIDAQSAKRDNFEFYRQLGLSPEVGTEEALAAYGKNIKNLKLFFRGKKKRVISNFKKEMNLYAKNREFERAGEMKRRIFALTHINDVALLKDFATLNFSPLRPSSGADGQKAGIRGQKIQGGYVFRIEAYDIAHMSGKNMVGVMTVLEDGEAAKHEYKKFKIRTQNNTNDTGALSEVLSRRLLHHEWQFPSLLVVDGGAAQLNAARAAITKARARVPVVAVVKDERHKAREIIGSEEFAKAYKREIILANSEAHRFAIAYHKLRRGKSFLPDLRKK